MIPKNSGPVRITAPKAATALKVPCGVRTLKRRAEFLKAARAKRLATTGFILQARRRSPAEDRDSIFVGYTCSKKVGNAVARNRAKRRLREVARDILPANGLPGWDYVLIGRARVTSTRAMQDLRVDLKAALAKLHSKTS